MRDITAEMGAAGVRAPAITAAVDFVAARLEELRGTLTGAQGRYEWASLPDSFLDALPELETALSDIATQLEGLGAGAGTAHCARRSATLANSLAALRELSDDTGLRWVDANPGGLLLQYTPFEIAERLREYVESRPCAWVFTSATLAVGEDFSHFSARIGLPEARTVCIDSPFDYRRQARIFLPPHMPEPQHPGFAAKFIEACAPLLEASGGRATLALHQLSRIGRRRQRLAGALPNPPFPVLVQGEAPREAQLLRGFRELGRCGAAGHRQLLGGRGCEGYGASVVTIDKLPFASRR